MRIISCALCGSVTRQYKSDAQQAEAGLEGGASGRERATLRQSQTWGDLPPGLGGEVTSHAADRIIRLLSYRLVGTSLAYDVGIGF